MTPIPQVYISIINTNFPLAKRLLILDELGKEGAKLHFQVISMCYEKGSIIITTNF